MKEWLNEYWYYLIAFIVVCVIAGFIFKKAAGAYKLHQKTFHEQEEEMRRLVELKNKYQILSDEVIANAPPEELLEGVALSYQLVLQKREDMTNAFLEMPKEKQYAYALDVFTSDKTAKAFFKQNGQELVTIIKPAFEMIGLDEFVAEIGKLATMFDEKDETTSLDWNLVEKTDEKFSEGDLLTKIKLKSAEYIKNNTELFK